MKNTWNIICKDILDKKRKQATEKEYQDLIYAHFRYLLGWHSERIETQHKLRVGSTVNFVYPDIVFFKNNDPTFVIEMKKPNHVQNKEEIVQLFSYMKLLPVQFGLYIGEFIELFYYEFSKEPISVLRIDFIEDSALGMDFIELFKHENFDIELLTDFCNIHIAKQAEQQKINELINELTTEKGAQILFDLLNNKLRNEGISSENIEKISNEIEINVCRKNHTRTIHIEQYAPTLTHVTTKNKQKDHTHYRLNGNGNYRKGDLALAIVQLYIKNNPKLVYHEIKTAIPFGIKKYSEIQEWKETTQDKSKDKRWHEGKEDLMVSADGITFAFTKEIGRGNIGEIIRFGEEQGYTIEAIK